jgi:hypothetical protein
MSARRTIKSLAESKKLTLSYISDYIGYKYPQHFARALNNSGGISAKKVVLLAEVLDEKKDYILTVLTRDL